MTIKPLGGKKKVSFKGQWYAQIIWKEKGEKQRAMHVASVLAIAVGFPVTASAPDYLIHQSCGLQIKLIKCFRPFEKEDMSKTNVKCSFDLKKK